MRYSSLAGHGTDFLLSYGHDATLLQGALNQETFSASSLLSQRATRLTELGTPGLA